MFRETSSSKPFTAPLLHPHLCFPLTCLIKGPPRKTSLVYMFSPGLIVFSSRLSRECGDITSAMCHQQACHPHWVPRNHRQNNSRTELILQSVSNQPYFHTFFVRKCSSSVIWRGTSFRCRPLPGPRYYMDGQEGNPCGVQWDRSSTWFYC